MKLSTKENLALVSLLAITFLSGAILILPKASADTEAVDIVTLTVPSSCSLSGTINTAHSSTIRVGFYVDDIGKTTATATCNDPDGFAVYAIGYTDDTYGKTVMSSDVSDDYDIATGLATSGATSNWAMKLTPIPGTYTPTIDSDTNGSFSDYHVVPSTYTKVAHYDSITDNITGGSFETTYAVYISGTQQAGNYEGQVKYTLVHPASEEPLQPQTATPGCINYFANASDAVGTMGCQSISSSATSATLLASNFSRSGYGFAGWSDSFDYATNPNAKFYGPQEDITFTAGQYTGTNNGLALYAVWVKSVGSLQDATKVAELCGTGGSLTTAPTNDTANLSSVSALTDQRDNQTYAIAKLADGKCWMIENLRLDNTAEHNSDGTLAQGYHSSFAGLANAESANFSDSNTANDLYTTENDIQGKITISGSYTGYRFPRYNNLNTKSRAQNSPSSNTFSNNNTDGGMYSYGNYYTWHAAIANTTHYSGPTAQVDGKTSETVATSLCPKGWKLPLGNTSTGDIEQGASDSANKVGGFSYLDRKMGGTGAYQSSADASLRWRKYPINFLYSGNFGSSSAGNRGSYGYYWSSTAYINNKYSYYLSLGSSNVSPGTNDNFKYYGRSIRCVSGS